LFCLTIRSSIMVCYCFKEINGSAVALHVLAGAAVSRSGFKSTKRWHTIEEFIPVITRVPHRSGGI
jgi:hypothetical protein